MGSVVSIPKSTRDGVMAWTPFGITGSLWRICWLTVSGSQHKVSVVQSFDGFSVDSLDKVLNKQSSAGEFKSLKVAEDDIAFKLAI